MIKQQKTAKTIVYAEICSYDFMFQRPAQLLRGLSRIGYKTVFVNRNYHLDGAKVRLKYEEIEPRHFVAPHGTKPDAFGEFILYTSYPPHIDIQYETHDPELIIFDSVDEPTGVFEFWNVGNAYYRILDKADIVLATAKRLLDRAKKHCEHAILVPNGCDYIHFTRPNTGTPPAIRNAKAKGKPIITYMGAVATWLDIDLIIRTARFYPDYIFLVIGAAFNTNFADGIPSNVLLTRHLPYEVLPEYINQSDVLTIPFDARQDVVKSCNPIKFWEYLCTGNPIVTTPLPELEPYQKDIFWSKNDGEYIENIGKAVEEGKDSKVRRKRKQLAKDNSWDARVAVIQKELEKIL